MPALTRLVRPGCARAASLVVGLVLVGEMQAGDFSYIITNNTITITGYTGPGGNVVIPTTIEGLPVTSIGDRAFSDLSSLTGVMIPDCVTNLGEAAFSVCTNLITVTIGNGIASIRGGGGTGWWGTFQWCTSLSRITIPDNVTAIGDGELHLGGALGAFYGCSSLTNVTVGKGLGYLGTGAFNYCSNLVGVYFQGDAPTPGVNYFGEDIFHYTDSAILYYLPGTTGWGPTYAGRPTMLWNPQVQTADESFGVRQNRLGFNVTGTAGIPMVIEACSNLSTGSWFPLQNCTLTNGSLYFSDPQLATNPARFYRLRSP